MTAPSLLDELEGVVRRITDDAAEVRRTGGDPERERHTQRIAVNFIRTHHAEIADMAKRMETAERDAATERAIQNAADKLPDGYAISLYVENGSGYIDLTDPEGDPVPVDTDDRSMADQITQATKVAIDAATQEGEG